MRDWNRYVRNGGMGLGVGFAVGAIYQEGAMSWWALLGATLSIPYTFWELNRAMINQKFGVPKMKTPINDHSQR